MGRKSKKKGKAAKSQQPSASSKNTPGPSCWICLDENVDDGRLPVRDCSCRGDSAGFAHASCLVQYAEQKCATDNQYIDPQWMKPFLICPNCNQKYRDELAIDLATACVDFAEGKQPDCLFRRMGALQVKLGAIVVYQKYTMEKVEECEAIARECLDAIEQMHLNPRMFSRLPVLRAVEADVYMLLGNVYLEGRDEISGRKAVDCFEKVKEVSGTFGVNVSARVYSSTIDARIAEAKALYEGEAEEDLATRNDKLKKLLSLHQTIVMQFGEGSQEAINHGMDVVTALRDAHRAVEAERFLDRMATHCRRVHGPDHFLTKAADKGLLALRARSVGVMHGNRVQPFQALRYVSSGTKCVVQGPIQNPRNTKKEITMEVDTVFPAFGTPVVLHGLKSATDLNGKVGDVRDGGASAPKGRFLVHLEGRKKPILVKAENLRIAFDLPEPTTSGESG